MSDEKKLWRAFMPFDAEGRIELAHGMYITRDTAITGMPEGVTVTEAGIEMTYDIPPAVLRAAEMQEQIRRWESAFFGYPTRHERRDDGG